MQAVAIQTYGSPNGLAVVDVPTPSPAAGQVLIDVEAIGVGGVDVMILSGAYASYGFREGHILGGEIAGTVAAVGAGVDPAWIGQRVWAFTGLGGGYAEQAVAPAATLVPLPADLSGPDAVTVGSSGRVAHFGLRHAHFTPGESVLIRGAAGGIGVMAVQLAARQGASAVAVTTSSPERAARLRALGATHILGRDGTAGSGAPGDPGDPDGYDVILDIVAGPDLPAFLDRLNPNGRLVALGAVAGHPPADFALRLFEAFQRSRSVATFSMNTVPAAEQHPATVELLADASRGALRAVVHEVLPLRQAALAHQRMDAGEVFGRIVLVP